MNTLELVLINGIRAGGTTKPLDVLAIDSAGITGKYLVKSFRNKSPNPFHAAKEIVSLEVAKLLDLPTPSYGIIDINDSDLEAYYPANHVLNMMKGYRFCSKFVENYVIFNHLSSTGFLRDYQVENIFAFDVLMYNIDRGGFHNKPNLLISDDELLMIDHELTLHFIDDNFKKVSDYESLFGMYPFEYHVLLKHLRAIRSKNHIFDEFCETLSKANFNSLNNVFSGMDRFGIEYGDSFFYLDYLNWCKNNVDILRKYLLGMI